MNDHLREAYRTAEGRDAEPSATIIDSQSVKTSDRGCQPGKRHIAVDTCGLLLCVLVHSAGLQDRDGAKPLLQTLRPSIA